MKKWIYSILVWSLCFYQSLEAQSSNIDREHFLVSYVDLPEIPTLDFDLRTYSSNNNAVYLSGFSKLTQNASIHFDLFFEGTQVSEVDIKKNKYEKKDKDGNVISTTYSYTAIAAYRSTAILDVIHKITSQNTTKEYVEEEAYASQSFPTHREAQAFFDDNRNNIRNKYSNQHYKNILHRANKEINQRYAYQIVEHRRDFFWILANKKHPEYAAHQHAYTQLKTIFETMRYDRPVDAIASAVQPIIAYFEDVATRYPGKKRKIRKIRFASYYNIANIYYYLDQPIKVKEYAQKIIDNNYDKSIGNFFHRIANQLIVDMKTNQTTTRHMEVVTEDLSNQPPMVFSNENTLEKEEARLHFAYLINKNQDTIPAQIFQTELDKMSAEVLLKPEDKLSKKWVSHRAANTQYIILENGDQYHSISFKTPGEKTASPKFAKQLFAGKRSQLFLHQNQELVLYYKNVYQSTRDKKFVFGFNKTLSDMAAACPSLQSKIHNGEYKNNRERVVAFCQALENCE
ncbi:MAG: hypothetical protein OIF50_08505 [Flavobacteriaceae bacterium]|nr:hypothetical protein [Flavobacteriaceae bacterium]